MGTGIFVCRDKNLITEASFLDFSVRNRLRPRMGNRTRARNPSSKTTSTADIVSASNEPRHLSRAASSRTVLACKFRVASQVIVGLAAGARPRRKFGSVPQQDGPSSCLGSGLRFAIETWLDMGQG
jgi:hypothetical protein